MKNKLFYEVENEYNTKRQNLLDLDNEIYLKDFLDIGFNNSYIYIDNKRYEVGYKYNEYLSNIYKSNYSSDFSLNDKQLKCLVKITDYDYDYDNYTIVYVKLVNESDKEYFIKEGKCL